MKSMTNAKSKEQSKDMVIHEGPLDLLIISPRRRADLDLQKVHSQDPLRVVFNTPRRTSMQPHPKRASFRALSPPPRVQIAGDFGQHAVPLPTAVL